MLSARETEVFRLWATGHTLKYIQEKLYLSPSTVKTHVRHIYDKTGVHSQSEIVELLGPLVDKRSGVQFYLPVAARLHLRAVCRRCPLCRTRLIHT